MRSFIACWATLLVFIISCREDGSSKSDENDKDTKPTDEVITDERRFEITDSLLTHKELIDILDHFYLPDDTKVERPEELKTRNFLNLISPDLKYYLGDSEKLSDYNFIPLKTMKEDDREKFLSRFEEGSEYTGYAVLSKKVWKHVFSLQDSGYQFGFIETTPSNRIAGIYSDRKKRLAIDIVAGEVTLIHEARHADQYNAIRHTKKGRIRGLSDKCYWSLHSLFAETDANSFEIKDWIGVMDRVKLDPEWHFNRDKVLSTDKDKSYPFTFDFNHSIKYPIDKAFLTIREGECPNDVNEFVEKLYSRIKKYKSKISLTAISLMQRDSMFRSWSDYYQDCDENALSLTPGYLNEDCKYSRDLNLRILESKKEKASKFNKILQEEVESRPMDLKEIYNKAPYKKEFCEEMIGFGYYADC